MGLGAAGDTQTAVDLLKFGAADFLVWPDGAGGLAQVLESLALDRAVAESGTDSWSDDEILWKGHPPVILVGQSAAMIRVRQTIRQMADAQGIVLLYGETGTGKEVVARAIHHVRHGLRGPFVAVNCAQMSGELIESQLFGHVKGAFTGAVADSQGFFRAAEGGTLLLDEISEMSPALQAKLLRALQEREVIPVGSTKPVPVNVAVIAATNRDPETAVAEGRLRQDLYYRLSQISLRLPPLRERAEDLPRLIRYFVGRHAKRAGARPKRIDPRVREHLLRHDWPGNVRELENLIHRILTFEEEEACLSVAHLVRHSPSEAAALARPAAPAAPNFTEADVVPLEELERRAIGLALAVTAGNRTRAAELLGIERHRLARRIRAHGLGEAPNTLQNVPAGVWCSTRA